MEGNPGEEVAVPSAASLPLKAIIRIRIPLKQPQVDPNQGENDDEGNGLYEFFIDAKSKKDDAGEGEQAQNQEEGKDQEAKPEEPIEEMELEDKALVVNPIGDTERVWVIHQAAGRYLRKDLVANMKKNMKEMENVDQDELD